MFKRVVQQKSSNVSEAPAPKPGNSLKPAHVDLRLTAHHGIPASASVLAHESGQRLLAIASRDGRIKIFGRDGVEVLLKSPTNAPCKYLEFVNNEGRLIHVTTRNEIEVWDLSAKELVSSKTWESDITAFAVIQTTAFIYIGDETGQVSVLQFNSEDQSLIQMQYTIPARVALNGLADCDASAPSVVSILPQPDAVHSRVVFVYGNGVIVLWGLHEAQVLAIRGGIEDQQSKLAGGKSIDSDEEEQEPCCSCWACPSGTLLAVGYTDGDILLWDMPTSSKGKAEKHDISSSPVLKIILSAEEFRMPVVVLRWSGSVKSDKGPSGYLYVFGGQEMGSAEVLTVLPIADPSCQMQLPLRGPFADVLVLPSAGAGGNGVVLILASPGSLDVYEESNISDSIKAEKPPAQPFSFRLPLTLSSVTCAKLSVIPEQSIVAGNILKIPRLVKGYVPPAFPSGTRWNVNGGNFSSSTVDRKSQPCLYITGHENGLLNVWDVSTPCLYFLTSVNNQGLLGSELTSISAIDFCATIGLLAAGDESGLVFVYSMQGEAGEGSCHFLGKNEPPRKREMQYHPGFQCFAVLNLHESAIKSLTIRSNCRCLAIGDDAGLITLFDIESYAVRFHGKCGSSSSIVSSCFMDLPLDSTSSTPLKQEAIVIVLLKDACIAAIDGNTGKTVGSGRPKNPSVALSLHLLDSSGAPVKSVSLAPTRKVSKRSVVMAVIETDSSGTHIEPADGNEEVEEDVKQDDDWTASDNLLLLCSEDSLRVYSISSVLQGMRTTIRKIRLERPCCSASIFGRETSDFGLLLLYDTGDIEVRSLPELDVIKVTSLTASLHWNFGSSSSFYRTFSVASNGRVAAVDADQELLLMSVIADENDMRLPGSYPLLFDKDLATATEAAVRASIQAAKKKQNQIQDLFGGVMKEIKHSLGTVTGGERTALELPKLFSKQVSPIATHGGSRIVKKLKTVATSPEPTTSERHTEQQPERHDSPSTDREPELDIDDIDLDDDDLKSHSPSEGPTKKVGVMRKLRSSFNKGKKKASIKMDEDEERNMLFEGGSTESAKPPSKMPGVRTAEEIKAAYGHRKAGEASSAAAHARDRLMERQERLQNINRRTEEMQDSAENFASMAEELAKKMESRKWWEI